MKRSQFALLFIAAFLGFAQTAHSYPTIGDEVIFKSSDGRTLKFDNNGFDGKVWIIFVDDGYSGMGYEYWSDAQIYHRKDVMELLSKCNSRGNVLEEVAVPAGKFQACKIKTKTGFSWIGDVPFGNVKIETSGTTLELKSFFNGKSANPQSTTQCSSSRSDSFCTSYNLGDSCENFDGTQSVCTDNGLSDPIGLPGCSCK
jgi:hypothetical protein